MVLVLSALEELQGVCRKSEVVDYIFSSDWIVLSGKDKERLGYSSDRRFENCLAWARKDAVGKGYMFERERDCWDITRDGLFALSNARKLFRSGDWSVSECFLWTALFKCRFDPAYLPSNTDARHPDIVFEEALECLCGV
jgi:hypothetical protein